MIDIGVARPNAHGHAMISTDTATTSALGSLGSGPIAAQTIAATIAMPTTAGTNHDDTRSASFWIGAREREASATMLHDLREQRVAAHPFGAHHETAGLVDRRAGDLAARGFLDRNRLAGHHRFVDARCAFEHDAVNGDFGARPHAQSIPGMHVIERDLTLGTVRFEAQRRRRRQLQQRLDGRRGLRARTQFEHLPEQHERRDHGRRLEIEWRIATTLNASGRIPGAKNATTENA